MLEFHCYGKLVAAFFIPCSRFMTTPDSPSQIPVFQEDLTALKTWIKTQALELGFSDCVIAKPDAQAELPRLQEYLERGYHGDMKFLEENLEKRANPTLLIPNTRSV